ncbi:MAG: hypothetical protein K2Y21_16205 [Phycisphaerales bacterium]|nr:hypothetical protein [Phycisphaerales bacterium]
MTRFLEHFRAILAGRSEEEIGSFLINFPHLVAVSDDDDEFGCPGDELDTEELERCCFEMALFCVQSEETGWHAPSRKFADNSINWWSRLPLSSRARYLRELSKRIPFPDRCVVLTDWMLDLASEIDGYIPRFEERIRANLELDGPTPP